MCSWIRTESVSRKGLVLICSSFRYGYRRYACIVTLQIKENSVKMGQSLESSQ